MTHADRFRWLLRFTSLSTFLLALIHLVLPWIAYDGAHPVIPVDNAMVLWEIRNNEMALVVLFLWAGLQAWTAAGTWPARNRSSLITALGLGTFFAADAIYLFVSPMPVPGEWRFGVQALTVFMALNALACFAAVLILRLNPSPSPAD